MDICNPEFNDYNLIIMIVITAPSYTLLINSPATISCLRIDILRVAVL